MFWENSRYLKDFSKITELKVGYDFKYFDQIARSGQRGEPLLSSSIDFYSLAKLPTYAGSYLETIWNIKRDEIRIKTTRLVYHKITRPTFSNLQTAMRSTKSSSVPINVKIDFKSIISHGFRQKKLTHIKTTLYQKRSINW